MASSRGGFFGVLRSSDDDDDDSSSSSSSGDDDNGKDEGGTEKDAVVVVPVTTAAAAGTSGGTGGGGVHIPSYEDLSTTRVDEITVLEAVYGAEDFAQDDGVWGCPLLKVRVRPPDVEDLAKIGSTLTLSVQLSKRYPYVVPAIELRDVRGLTRDEQLELAGQLRVRAEELSKTGSVMMIELVQVAEDYLLAHNRDPTLSEWEQMKVREASQIDQERKLQNEMNRLMNSATGSPREDEGSTAIISPRTSRTGVSFNPYDMQERQNQLPEKNEAIEREMLRQREAFQAARLNRKDAPLLLKRESTASQTVADAAGGAAGGYFGEGDDDDDADMDFDDVYPGRDGGLAWTGTSSRYKSDFIELGVLGRGGGGEVVKVRNRLDRRVYAVKKILLESEAGKSAKYGAVQNRKLRREVTTISRMTHKNIVRYYQAWVEGGSEATVVESIEAIPEEGNNTDANVGLSGQHGDASSSDEESAGGWWADDSALDSNTHGVVTPLRGKGEDDDMSARFEASSNAGSEAGRSDEDNDPGFHSPLLGGLGFQNQMYGGLFDDKPSPQKLSESEVDMIWEESTSMKIGSTTEAAILYIQMEYCSTTLRKLIDEGECEKMEQNEIWRLVRQTLEALVYIHSRNIIHRGTVQLHSYCFRFGSELPQYLFCFLRSETE